MKKAAAAGLLLAAMLALSLWNIRHVDRFTGELTGQLRQSMDSCRQGNAEEAEQLLRAALERWHREEGYTHIFIRHAEVDAATDAFYEILTLLQEENEGVYAAYGRLEEHLRCISAMEHITVKSVF